MEIKMKYIFFNPLSGNGKSKAYAESLAAESKSECKLVDVIENSDIKSLISSLGPDDEIILCGGDGTLNHFVNDIADLPFENNVYYYPSGTGNDFFLDVAGEGGEALILINDYIRNLPTVKVNGMERKFINGIGYGIDGYCCEVGDKIRSQGKVANYTSIAIKGLLFHYKPKCATVIVDGEESTYKKVWIAPTMFGRRYGGGMIPTPAQNRKSEPAQLSLMVFHGSNKIKTLMIFPSIFKGEHVKHTECVEVLTGKEITVKFDKPTALQIDGETVLNVTEYSVKV
jgi:diacylglycerol kinase family enzyme